MRQVERADADALFASFDEDGSGEIEYSELHKVTIHTYLLTYLLTHLLISSTPSCTR